MIRRITLGVLAVFGTLALQSTAKADAVSKLVSLYGGSASDWVKVNDDKLWFREPATSTGRIQAKTVAASGTFLLGTSAASGSPSNVFGAVTGTGVTQAYNLRSGQLENADYLGGLILLDNITSPFAWDFTRMTDSSFGTAGHALDGKTVSQVLNSGTTELTRNSMSGSPDYMVAYRNVNWTAADYNRYIIMWEFDNPSASSDYDDLVLDVKGVKNPEPTSMALMGLGVVGLAGYGARWMRRRKLADATETEASIA